MLASLPRSVVEVALAADAETDVGCLVERCGRGGQGAGPRLQVMRLVGVARPVEVLNPAAARQVVEMISRGCKVVAQSVSDTNDLSFEHSFALTLSDTLP